jgi:hypothetical protein
MQGAMGKEKINTARLLDFGPSHGGGPEHTLQGQNLHEKTIFCDSLGAFAPCSLSKPCTD